MWTLAAARRSTVIKNRWPTRACSGRDFGARLRVYTPSGLHWAADSPWAPKMNTIIILRRPERPADLIRRLIRDGLIPGLVLTLFLVLVQFEASKECRGGAFSAGFGGGGFDVHRCDLVVRRIGSDRGLRIPLPQH